MYRRAYSLLIGTAAVMLGLAVYVAIAYDRWELSDFPAMPLKDPESSFLGPGFIRLPVLIIGAILLDLLPRAVWLSRGKVHQMGPIIRDRWREHWDGPRRTLVVLGIACFYITYVSYRNLKSNLPFVRTDPTAAPGEVKALSYDRELHLMDKVLFFGHNPADVLHGVFGTTITAHVLSPIYLAFLPMVPLGVTVWLVWSRNLSYGYWFVTSQCLTWSLGTLSYYLLPTVGPGIERVGDYIDLAHTGTTDLMDSITNARGRVLHDPTAVDAVNSVAGFASLHCAVTLLVALLIQHTLRSRVLTWIGWVNFVLTVIATLYFGWHYVADDIAGIAIAILAFYLGGIASGQKFDRGFKSHPTTTTDRVPMDKGDKVDKVPKDA